MTTSQADGRIDSQPQYRLIPFESPSSPYVKDEGGRHAPIFRIIELRYPGEGR